MDELTPGEAEAFARLRALLELLPSEMDRQMTATGLTAFEFTLLEALHFAALNRLRLSALAAQTSATLPRLSRVASGLERRGLINRAPCAEDGRAINAVLTAAGEVAYAAARPVYDRAVRTLVLDGLDPAGLESMSQLTLSILRRLDPA